MRIRICLLLLISLLTGCFHRYDAGMCYANIIDDVQKFPDGVTVWDKTESDRLVGAVLSKTIAAESALKANDAKAVCSLADAVHKDMLMLSTLQRNGKEASDR